MSDNIINRLLSVSYFILSNAVNVVHVHAYERNISKIINFRLHIDDVFIMIA